MIVVDSSAVLAILQSEPESVSFQGIIQQADRAVISAVSVLEAGMVLRGRRGPTGLDDLGRFLVRSAIETIPFDAALAAIALEAFGRYGKGIHSGARLNLGDCASYALAKSVNAPWRFKGNDFGATDVTAAA